MKLTPDQHNIFHRTFDSVCTHQPYFQPGLIRVERIRVEKDNMIGKILCTLIQQNILKEFLIEREDYLKRIKHNINDIDISNINNVADPLLTFNWGNAIINNKTTIKNWGSIIIQSQKPEQCSGNQLEDIVVRGA